MVRRIKDPWAKKSKKGIKSLETIGKLSIGTAAMVGTGIAHEIKSTQKTSQANSSPINGVSLIVMLLGTVIGAGIGFGCVGGFWGVIVTALLVFVSIFVGAIVGLFVKEPSQSPQVSKPRIIEQTPVVNLNKEKLIAIKDLIFSMSPYKDYYNVLASLSTEERKDVLINALNAYYAEMAMSMEIPSESENYTDELIKTFSLPVDSIQNCANKSYLDYQGALNLQDMLIGILPRRVTIAHPINMSKDEQPLWVFPAVSCYEEVITRSNAGVSRAISVKIAKGIYYHTGAFKGEPIITSNMKAIATGDLIITNKCLYLYSTQRSSKYPINKILAYVPFEDGIGVQLDGAKSKTIYFSGLDGTYAYNVVSNIKNITES